MVEVVFCYVGFVPVSTSDLLTSHRGWDEGWDEKRGVWWFWWFDFCGKVENGDGMTRANRKIKHTPAERESSRHREREKWKESRKMETTLSKVERKGGRI